MLLWVPVEKMFMTQIGFNAAAIGLVAAVYAAVAPALEVPFGILADRWSRTGMMILATVALAVSSLVGGLSTTPAMYVGSAALLGVFFALNSGTADSIVYDTVVEETGSGEAYERWIGRLHLVEASALVASALLGGLLAALTSARITYFVTVPLVAIAILAFGRCREPQLHRATERVSFRQQALATVRVLTADRTLRPVVLLTAFSAVVATVLFEFGPLWLVSLHAPAGLYGPYWAALVSTVGLGGWLASRARLNRPGPATGWASFSFCGRDPRVQPQPADRHRRPDPHRSGRRDDRRPRRPAAPRRRRRPPARRRLVRCRDTVLADVPAGLDPVRTAQPQPRRADRRRIARPPNRRGGWPTRRHHTPVTPRSFTGVPCQR